MKGKRATITDVAKHANVSITTVSRVINNNYPVSEKTKARVNAAIETLNFQPNLLARSLIQDKSQTIGILTPSIENLFFSEVIKGIDSLMEPKDYRSFLCNTKGKAENERVMVDSLCNRSVDGIIVINPKNENIHNGYFEKIAKRIPLVIINGYNEDVACHFVLNDVYAGTQEALTHLKKQGAKRIAFMRGGENHSYDVKETLYREFCKEEGGGAPVLMCIEEGNGLETVTQARECALEFFRKQSREEPIEGILCCNDFMAVGVLNAARIMHVSVPEDLAIVGFDNTLVSQITAPALTTVDQHMSQLGRNAAQQICRLMAAKTEKKHVPETRIIVTTHLVVRQT